MNAHSSLGSNMARDFPLLKLPCSVFSTVRVQGTSVAHSSCLRNVESGWVTFEYVVTPGLGDLACLKCCFPFPCDLMIIDYIWSRTA